jgi:hypothetical protein
MVKLTPEQPSESISAHLAFVPASGAWGRQGCTTVVLAAADPNSVGEAMTLARQNVAVRAGGRGASTKSRSPKFRASATSSLRERARRGERTPAVIKDGRG